MTNVAALNIGGVNRPIEDSTARDSVSELLQQTNGLRKGRNLLEVFDSEIAKYDDEMQWLKDRLDMKYVKGLMIRDYIPITCTDGEEFEEQIAGINSYYNTTDQPVPYHIDFISRDCAKDTVQWNTTNNNNGTADQKNPYIASNLHKYLNETLYAKLPDKVKNVIAEKRMLVEDRYSADGALTDSTGWHWDSLGKLWVPSEVEVFGQVVWGTKGWSEGQAIRYPIFENYADILKGIGKGGSRYYWWLLSAYSGDSTRACYVDGYGDASNWDASNSRCVPLCFRVTA